ncbi:hypothetical protein ABW02_23290 [Niallia circulans]|uniref:Uncharacterized protein n=1 Tax=Niallia circulans TaxID=1397 RepID=A0A0J1I3Y8_NIACI|nr:MULTISPECIES: hypothetical protein [Bacillaceae]KAB7665686.1 hypothetical protein F9279_19605 [Bacillus sp. B1-b2]KLV20656.1 hypothetical protein ABW02_23290 [Niallia circulans]MCF2649958.1 hypothetical protein [Niallia circulans]CAI9394879.1 hypothetical protein BACSP_03938 [Bacillus sp. T2.9-1]
MKYLLYGSLGLVVIFIVLYLVGYYSLGIIINIMEWSTKYILPWVALYWFIQFVKGKKRIKFSIKKTS